MAVLFQLRDAHKRYGDQILLDGAEIALSDDRKVGLIGRNGAGKSTLCRILLGEEELDAGEVVRGRSLRLGYLQQHDPFEPGETVVQFLQRDSRQPEWRCGEIAWQFGVQDALLESPVQELSGGWQTRVKLAALLLHDPNLLILDEPTNFLDLRTQLFLEQFLSEFRGGCLIVSHDRGFLKATCNHTVEHSQGQLRSFPGDVDIYLQQLAERREHDRRANASVLTKRRQLERFINKNRANANTASQARSKAKQLERLQTVGQEADEGVARIRVPEVEPRRGPALRCEELAIGYPDHRVASGINLEIEHGSRVAVVGDNGQGKTTFLRTVAQTLRLLEGNVRWGYGCQVGVYAQHVYLSLPSEKTVLEYLEYESAPGTKAQTVLDVAGSFLFQGEFVEKRIKVLSGGERARLCLAGILLGSSNVLILDEPANHLDVESVEALAAALCDYRGTVIFTAHDRHFVRRTATGVIEVRDGRVTYTPADYDAYVYRVRKEVDEGLREVSTKGNAPARSSKKAGPRVGQNVKPSADRKKQTKQRHDARKEIASIERKIARLDELKRQLDPKLLATTDAEEAEKLHQQLSRASAELAELEERWFKLQSETGELDEG